MISLPVRKEDALSFVVALLMVNLAHQSREILRRHRERQVGGLVGGVRDYAEAGLGTLEH